MKTDSRSKNFVRNSIFGFGTQVLQTILPFVSRTIFIRLLGATYLGIGGLFSSILSVLSLADLGLSNVVIFSLYKPVAENDEKKIVALIKFYRKLYNYIALIVLVIGLSLLPFLDYLVNLPESVPHLRLYYILYIINSALSYLYVYKTSLIRANQKNYIISLYTTVCSILMNGVQICGLLLVPNFTLYLIVQILFTFLQNVLLSKRAEHMYGDKLSSTSIRGSEEISVTEKKKIFSDAKSMLSYRIGSVLLNSIDSILISSLVNTIIVGFYSNYLTLESFINKFINVLYDSFTMGVGNLNAEATQKKQKEIFDVLCFVFNSIAVICTVGIISVSNDIITIWIGEEYLMSYSAVIAFAMRFFLPVVLYPVWIYRNTTGLFKETQNILFYTGILNLVLSVVLGRKIGLAGILIATVFARLLTSFWFEPYILYKKRFASFHVSEYFRDVLATVFITIISFLGVQGISMCFETTLFIKIIFKMILCVSLSIMLLFIYYRKTVAYTYVLKVMKNKLRIK